MDTLSGTLHLLSTVLSVWPVLLLGQKYILLQLQEEANAYKNSINVLLDGFNVNNKGKWIVTNPLHFTPQMMY